MTSGNLCTICTLLKSADMALCFCRKEHDGITIKQQPPEDVTYSENNELKGIKVHYSRSHLKSSKLESIETSKACM